MHFVSGLAVLLTLASAAPAPESPPATTTNNIAFHAPADRARPDECPVQTPTGRLERVWAVLERMSRSERENSYIDIVLESDAPAARELADAIAADWNAGRWDKALSDFPRLAELVGTGDIAIGNAWRTPVPTLDTRLWGNDVRIGNRDSALLVRLDIHRPTGNLAAVVLHQGDGNASFWTMNHSTNGGTSWSETYFWYATYDLRSLSASVLGRHCYIAFGRGPAQNQALLYRCRMSNGIQEGFSNGQNYVTVMTTATGDSIAEVALTSSTDFYDNRLYYLVLTTAGRLRYYWSDSAAVSWDSNPGLAIDNARGGLDACTNLGDSSFIFVSYYDRSDTVHITARRGTGWRNLSRWYTGPTNSFYTDISAYQDTILCAFQHATSAPYHIRTLRSLNGGTSWSWAAPFDSTVQSELPGVALRAGGGSALVCRYRSPRRELRYTWRRYIGNWATPVNIASFEPFLEKPAVEYLGSGAYGVVYANWQESPQRRVFFDRSDWTGLAEQRRLIVQEGVLAVTPNPIAGTGRVRLELARPAMLDVKVVDRSGRVVAGVYRGNRPAGRSELPLDATRLTPGVYFLRAVANGEPLTVPFTVVR